MRGIYVIRYQGINGLQLSHFQRSIFPDWYSILGMSFQIWITKHQDDNIYSVVIGFFKLKSKGRCAKVKVGTTIGFFLLPLYCTSKTEQIVELGAS